MEGDGGGCGGRWPAGGESLLMEATELGSVGKAQACGERSGWILVGLKRAGSWPDMLIIYTELILDRCGATLEYPDGAVSKNRVVDDGG